MRCRPDEDDRSLYPFPDRRHPAQCSAQQSKRARASRGCAHECALGRRVVAGGGLWQSSVRPRTEEAPIDDLLKAFADRLKKVAGFKYVSQALPMRNSTGVTLYHLIFATHYEAAVRIANGVLKSE